MCRRWSMSQIPTSRSLRSSDDRLYLRVKAGSCSDWTMQSAFHERELGSFGEFRSEVWRRSLSLLRLPEPHEGSIGLCVCDVLACFVGALMGQCWRNRLFVVNWASFLERKAEIPFLVFSKCLRSEDTRQAARNNTYMRFTPCRQVSHRWLGRNRNYDSALCLYDPLKLRLAIGRTRVFVVNCYQSS